MSGVVRPARYAYIGLLWLFVVGVAAQALLAGIGLFVDARDWASHITVGYAVSVIPALVLIAALVGRAGRRTVVLALVLTVLAFVQTVLPLAGDSAPYLAALHPVNALVLFGLGARMALEGRVLLAQPTGVGGPIPG